jgi:hypothetical protein
MSVAAVKKTKEKIKNIPKSIYFEPKTVAAVEAHMKSARLGSFNLAVIDAVEYALYPEHRNDRNADVVKLCTQILYSINEHRTKTARDMTFLHEMTALQALNYFTHTHQIPASEKAAAEAQAKARMREFMEQAVRNMSKSVVEGLLREAAKKVEAEGAKK